MAYDWDLRVEGDFLHVCMYVWMHVCMHACIHIVQLKHKRDHINGYNTIHIYI